MFDFIDDVFEGISDWFGDGADIAGEVGDVSLQDGEVFGSGPFGDGTIPEGGSGGSSLLGKLGSAALGAGVNIMKNGGGLGSRTNGRISSGISVDRMGNERPRQAEGPSPLTSADPRVLSELWNTRMRDFSRLNAITGGKGDATK